MSVLAMPPSPSGSVQQQLSAQYGYLFQLAQQLNAALGALDGRIGRDAEATAAAQSSKGIQQYDTLRTMIVRTADAASEAVRRLAAQLETVEAADAPQTMCLRMEAAADSTLRGDAQTLCHRMETFADACRDSIKCRGIVRYEGGTPVYGAAVGDGLSAANGVVEPSGIRAVFTPQELGIWQDDTEVVRIANRRVCAKEADISAVTAGAWRVETADGLCVRWMGGNEDGSDSQ